jgi:type I restriction enzyme S subunit
VSGTTADQELPNGWRRLRVADVLKLRNGRAFKSDEWMTTGRPIIRIQNLKSAEAPFNYFDGDLPEQFAARSGDLLFAWSGTPGTSFGAHIWRGPDAWVNQHIFRVDFSSSDFVREFLKRALDVNLASYVDQAQGGVGLAHITKSKLNESRLLAPPLAEQRRIAACLDEVDARCAAIYAHLEAATASAERLRSAVLQSAYAEASQVEGSDTTVPLERVLREPLRNGYSARPVSHETPYRVLTLTATTRGVFDPRHFKYTDESFPPESPLWLTPGDLLIQRGNTAEYVGVPALYEGGSVAFIYPDLMIRARVRREIDPRFVWYMLLAPQARSFLRERATGTAGNMPKINQKALNAVPVPMPPAELRAAIVERLDQACALAGAAVKRLDTLSTQLDRTKKAALVKAFRAELVATEATRQA